MGMVTVRPQPGGCSVANGTLSGGSDVGTILSGGSGGAAYVRGVTNGAGLGVQTNISIRFQTAPIPVGSQIYQYTLRVRHNWATQLYSTFQPNNNYGAPASTTNEQPSSFYQPLLQGRYLSFSPIGSAGTYNALIGSWFSRGSQSMAQQNIVTKNNPTDLDIQLTLATFIFAPDQILTNNLYEVFLDVFYDAPPTVAISAPIGAVANATPAITFTPTDPEGAGIQYYRIKIFSDAVYTTGMFDPNTATVDGWDSGIISLGQTSGLPFTTYVGGNGLQNNKNYRIFIQAGDTTSGGRMGQWFTSDFSTNFATPGNPSNVSVIPDSANALYVIKFTSASGAVSTDVFDIQRSDDGGFTWNFIRGGQQLHPVAGVIPRLYAPTPSTIQCTTSFGFPRINAGSNVVGNPFRVGVSSLGAGDFLGSSSVSGLTVTAVPNTIQAKASVYSPVSPVETIVTDMESIPLTPPQYRVRSVHYYVAGFSYSTSAWVAITPSTMQALQWHLKDPITGKNISIEVVPPFTITRREGVSFYDGVGRSTSFYMSDGIKGIEASVKIRTKSQMAYNALLAILATGNVLLLEDWTYGRRWYVKFADGGSIVTISSAPDIGSTSLLRHLHEQSYTVREMASP